MKPKVEISGHYLRDESAMMRVIDAGYVLKNRIDDEQRDCAIFDIEGPGIPDCDFVDLFLRADGSVCVEPSEANYITIQYVARHFNVPPHMIQGMD